jgi:transposase
MGKSPNVIRLDEAERHELEKRAREQRTEYRRVIRARIILYAADGMANTEIATRLDTPVRVVSIWRKRFFQQRFDGLEDRSRSGRPRRFSPRDGCISQGARV